MTLTTHIAIATAVTRPIALAHPVFIFISAIASHYLSDLIPHWDYKLKLINQNGEFGDRSISSDTSAFWSDLMHAAGDAIFGTLLTGTIMWLTGTFNIWWLSASAIGGVLPDFSKGIYALLGRPKPMDIIMKFDDMMHTNIRLGPYPLIGIPFQMAILLVAILFLV